jgi:D-beta-D-heptose 7-phosphate kinase/D-beta-D-heptose 1-phosphate adenosyltransferase
MNAEEKKELLEITEKFPSVDISVLGDLILDEYVWGTVDRISPEAPVVVVKVKDESYRLGGAANVAHNIVSLGGKARLFGFVGDDSWGRDVVDLLQKVGVQTQGVVAGKQIQTTLKTRVVAHGQQVVRIDRESDFSYQESTRAELLKRLSTDIEGSRGFIVSDYAKGVIDKPLLSELTKWYKTGKIGSTDLPVLYDPKDINFGSYSGATVVTPNKKEAQEASGVRIQDRADAMKAADILAEKWDCENVLVTLGELGMVLAGGSKHVEIATVAREVYDVSGAGDTVSAAFLLSMAAGGTPYQAAIIANQAAGIVVREVGTAVVSLEKLQEEIDRG